MVTVAVMHDGSNEIARASKIHAPMNRTMCREVAALTSPPSNVLIVFLPAPHCHGERTGGSQSHPKVIPK